VNLPAEGRGIPRPLGEGSTPAKKVWTFLQKRLIDSLKCGITIQNEVKPGRRNHQ